MISDSEWPGALDLRHYDENGLPEILPGMEVWSLEMPTGI